MTFKKLKSKKKQGIFLSLTEARVLNAFLNTGNTDNFPKRYEKAFNDVSKKLNRTNYTKKGNLNKTLGFKEPESKQRGWSYE